MIAPKVYRIWCSIALIHFSKTSNTNADFIAIESIIKKAFRTFVRCVDRYFSKLKVLLNGHGLNFEVFYVS